MRWLSDSAVSRLQEEVQWPELEGTRYRAIQLIGRGGMGTVWQAEDTVLRRVVALKILALELGSPDLAARLLREAEVLAQLEHPGIVPVHDAGTLADGRTFYCMKFVEGRTLDECISNLTQRERLQLVQRIAEPLAFAHSRGIIHRDLKPGNVMVGAFGEVLIVDWGLAKISAESLRDLDTTTAERNSPLPPASGHPVTGHGAVLGTPGFMAPEQERGEVDRVDQRTDVFGLGALLRFMLSQPADSAPVSRPLQAICEKAMAGEMSARYASVESMNADIARYLDGLPISAYRENLLERSARLFRRHQAAVVLVLVYLLMRALFILFSRR